MRFKKINDNITLESFDSVREFTKVSVTRKPNTAFSGLSLNSETPFHKAWYGTTSFDAANKIMSKGYKDGCKDLLSCKDGIKIMNEDIKIHTIKNYAGFAPCVPAALMGIPKSMYQKKRNIVKNPVINLYFDSGVSADVGTDKMILGGKNLYSLCKYLDSRNIRVNLFIFIGVWIKANKHAFLSIKVKNSDMPINPQLISYPVIHPSFFRRHVFKWIETSKGTDYNELTRSYGVNSRYRDDNIRKTLLDAKILDENSYYIDVEDCAKCSTLEDLLLRIGLKL